MKAAVDISKGDTATASPSRADSYRMFNRISRRYDLLNRLLSFGLDIHWRRKLVDLLAESNPQCVVDLACGTGDVILTALKQRISFRSIVGIDKAEQMLKIAGEKLVSEQNGRRALLVKADGLALPIADGSTEAVTIAFGIRNMTETELCLREMWRILVPKGRALILEFSLPSNRVWRRLHLFYLRNVVPLLGRIISGDRFAYSYLNRTIETYPYGERFCDLMKKSGFAKVSALPLTGGIVTIYRGEKH